MRTQREPGERKAVEQHRQAQERDAIDAGDIRTPPEVPSWTKGMAVVTAMHVELVPIMTGSSGPWTQCGVANGSSEGVQERWQSSKTFQKTYLRR